MHPMYEQANQISHTVIGAAIEVHRIMGPGLIESIYERCLLHELELRGLSALRQQTVHVCYKDMTFEENLRFDLLVEGCVLVELKCVQEMHPVFQAQLISYLKLLDVPIGLLMNFHEQRLTDGLQRVFLPGANK